MTRGEQEQTDQSRIEGLRHDCPLLDVVDDAIYSSRTGWDIKGYKSGNLIIAARSEFWKVAARKFREGYATAAAAGMIAKKETHA